MYKDKFYLEQVSKGRVGGGGGVFTSDRAHAVRLALLILQQIKHKINYKRKVAGTFENTYSSVRVINLSTVLRFHAPTSVGASPQLSQLKCRGI